METDRRPREELAAASVRAIHWGRLLIRMCEEHEHLAKLVHASPWFIAPMSLPLRELRAALADLEEERTEAAGATAGVS